MVLFLADDSESEVDPEEQRSRVQYVASMKETKVGYLKTPMNQNDDDYFCYIFFKLLYARFSLRALCLVFVTPPSSVYHSANLHRIVNRQKKFNFKTLYLLYPTLV